MENKLFSLTRTFNFYRTFKTVPEIVHDTKSKLMTYRVALNHFIPTNATLMSLRKKMNMMN